MSTLEAILVLAYALMLFVIIEKWGFFRLEKLPISAIRLGFILKVSAGVTLGIVYSKFYPDRATADTYNFFDDSAFIFNTWNESPLIFIKLMTGIDAYDPCLQTYYNQMNRWYDVYSPLNDNRTMIRFNAILRFISFGYYNVHVLFVNFLSLIGIVSIVKVVSKHHKKLTIISYMCFILVPSVLFWGSGLLKDSLSIFAIGMCVYHVDIICEQKKLNTRIISQLTLSLMALTLIRFQIMVIFTPLLIGWIIASLLNKNPLKTSIATLSVFALFFIIISKFESSINIAEMLYEKQKSFIELASQSNAGSEIEIRKIEPNFESLFINLPHGLASAIIRPTFFDGHNSLSWISVTENIILLMFLIICCINCVRHFEKNIDSSPLLWFAILFALSYLAIIGTITPVLGAMVRYKAQALPFLLIGFAIIGKLELILTKRAK